MKQLTELARVNPVSESEGERWALSPEGAHTLGRIVERAYVDVVADQAPKAAGVAIGALAAAAVLAATAGILWLARHDPAAPALGACPMTISEVSPFVPPPGYPPEPTSSFRGDIWYGTDQLWTVLDVDGGYANRKSVWWSVEFHGGALEGAPDIEVTARQLDGNRVITSGGLGTNAYTAVDGWFMIADFPFELPPGCWEVTGSYKRAELSFTVAVPGSE